MRTDFLKEELRKVLSKKRYEHSIRVYETAITLGKNYNVDLEKLSISALLHDYAKEYNPELLKSICKTFFFKETKSYLNNVEVLHGIVASHIAKEKFNIDDIDTLNAIKFHTTGRKKMSVIEKIIYLADAIEPKRNYENIEKIRKLSQENLDDAILLEVNEKLKYLIKNNIQIHPDSIKMRNYILKKIR